MMHPYLNPFFLFQLLLEMWRAAPSCYCDSNQGRKPCTCKGNA
jgi:hypothetical protein